MKKFLPGIFAILLAVGFSAFTNASKSKFTTYYFKNTGSDKNHTTWVLLGTTEPSPSDCATNSSNWCYGTSTSQTGTVTGTHEGNYIGL